MKISVRISQIPVLLQPVLSHITPDIISLTSVLCAEQSELVSYKTIKVYLAAIHLHHIEHGAPDPTADDLLQLVQTYTR